MKFGDRVIYGYEHYLNRKSSFWMEKEAIFIKQEGENVWVICKGNKSITKTTAKNIKEDISET